MQENREPGGSATRWAHSSADAPATGPRPGKALGDGEHRSTSMCSTAGVVPAASHGCRRIVARAALASTLPWELIEFAAERTPEGDFRVGDLEALSWPDDSFNAVTGFSVFQFADDKVRLSPMPSASHAGRWRW